MPLDAIGCGVTAYVTSKQDINRISNLVFISCSKFIFVMFGKISFSFYFSLNTCFFCKYIKIQGLGSDMLKATQNIR